MRRLIRLAGAIGLSNCRELRSPYKLTFALTYRCQFSCAMCGIGARSPLPELSTDEIAEFFRRSNRFSWVNLSGGEIFLREDLRAIIAAMSRHCRDLYVLNFPTNGYQTDHIIENVREIVRSTRIPRILVTVSLDGPPDVHDRIRNKPGSWERAVETFRGLRQLRGRRFNVLFGMTLQDANAGLFPETVRSAAQQIGDVRDDDFHVNVQHTSSHYYANTTRGAIRDAKAVLQGLRLVMPDRRSVIIDPVELMERRYRRLTERYLLTGRTPVKCQAFGASLFLDPAGTVYPCTIFDRPIGNLRDAGYALEQLWNDGRRQALRWEILQGCCPHCWTPCEAYPSMLANLLSLGTR
ncbi:MAG: radical SAM protein [Nitrospiraceae bacterium]|nr:radical SAM protein [Nitrospiraceae bacterium]